MNNDLSFAIHGQSVFCKILTLHGFEQYCFLSYIFSFIMSFKIRRRVKKSSWILSSRGYRRATQAMPYDGGNGNVLAGSAALVVMAVCWQQWLCDVEMTTWWGPTMRQVSSYMMGQVSSCDEAVSSHEVPAGYGSPADGGKTYRRR